MKKAYSIAPVAALALFIGLYINFQSGYKAREAAKIEQGKIAREARLEAEVADRRRAIEDALKSREIRRKEHEAKEARDKLDRETRRLALDARDDAHRQQEKLGRQIERLKKDIITEKEALAKVQDAKDQALSEQVFLKEFVTKAEANAKALEDVLTKIAAAEAARAAAKKS